MNSEMKNFIEEGHKNFVDLTTGTEFVDDKDFGAITLQFTSQGTRTKLSKALYEDIGSPKRVRITFHASCISIVAAADAKACAVCGDGLIYNAKLARGIAKLADVEIQTKGSKKIGSYHLQKTVNDMVAAVVTFDSDRKEDTV